MKIQDVQQAFHYIHCETEKQRQDAIILCELMGFKPYNSNMYEFPFCSYVLICGGTYQLTSDGHGPVNMTATDLLRDNFYNL